MKIECKYFGSVAEAATLSSEMIEIETGSSLKGLDELIKKKYPTLHFLSYQFAVNQQISILDTAITEADEIALLPPFGGG